jgi:hypothetical protein
MQRMKTLGLAATAGLLAGIVLQGQPQDERAASKTNMVVHRIEVHDGQGHYINGLQPKDFRILEDGIVQKINTFAEGNKPPVQVLDDGSTRPLGVETWRKQVEAFESIRESLENAYVIAYYPAQNPNQGFRKIDVQIVSDVGKNFRVRHKAGYRQSR